jgi:sec-independent protein translocase protein TatA
MIIFATKLYIMNTILLWMPGGSEWIIILVVVVFLFGGKKIPELMRGLGQGIREFNTAKGTIKSHIEEGMKEPVNNAPAPPTTTDNTTNTI